ncbi:DNA polymerase III epsilon subunit [Gordonia araii NBRC 100433]|uniref:DNA polymerase III epsilon subunit n=1 Tax=Gordonia araii NBRC 100433 TaxID=1073574 RepID=G7H7L4_9ACTN|nr:DNA polymerase III epsilon subunit [Gordonia araii NBRC 100433]
MRTADPTGTEQLDLTDSGLPDVGMPRAHPAPRGPGSHRRLPAAADLAEMAATVRGGIEQSLATTPFVVLDLETTGGSAERDAITEIGAVKVCGGEVVGEFATLVDPDRAIPDEIVALTGITETMVSTAPRIGEVLASFLEFARGCVLVAHNSRFDLGFLSAAARRLGLDWHFPATLCTVALARRVLTREEAPSVRLADLAILFRASTTPTHRALDDARATVDVLHGLLERIGNRGVGTFAELLDFLPRATPAQRAKRGLARDLPRAPGVYLFRGPSDEVLYVGTAVDLRRRVRSYFAGDSRPRIAEMVALATRVDHVVCAHDLEAGVRELRLLAAHNPAYNRRSTQPRRGWWVCLTEERFPRFVVRRHPRPEPADVTATPTSIGPIPRRATAQLVSEALTRAAGLRSCTTRLGGRADYHWCAPRAAVGDCAAATERPESVSAYLPRVQTALDVLSGRSDAALRELCDAVTSAAASEHFETAARRRDQLAETVSALERTQRLRALCAIEQIVVARPDSAEGWRFSVVRHGRLAGAGTAVRGTPPMPVVDAVVAAAQTIVPDDDPLRGAPAEEASLVYRWVTAPDSRIVDTTGGFALPRHSACGWERWRATARSARHAGAGH